MRDKTQEFKDRLAAGETLDDLLVEAYALVREAARRVLHTEHYRVQLMGGIILHQGRIAEMRTGEGKTQTCLLPAYLNALEGKGVILLRLMIILPSVMPSGWVRYMNSSDLRSELFLTVWMAMRDVRHIILISHI